MNQNHPLADLMRDYSLNSVNRIDTLSLQRATTDIEDVIKKELAQSILKHYFEEGNGADALEVRPSEELERVREYHMQLYIFSPDEMFNVLMEAFNRGMDLQYREMYRVLGEQIAKAEEQKLNDAKQTSKE